MGDFTWPCDPYRTDCTHLATAIRLIPHGLQSFTGLILLDLQILTESIPFVRQIHA